MNEKEMLSSDDRLRDEVLAAIARSGKCYVNEARAMAGELIQLRAKKTESEAFAIYFSNNSIIGRTP